MCGHDILLTPPDSPRRDRDIPIAHQQATNRQSANPTLRSEQGSLGTARVPLGWRFSTDSLTGHYRRKPCVIRTAPLVVFFPIFIGCEATSPSPLTKTTAR